MDAVRRRLSIESLKDHPVVRAYRDFYWRIKIDPTKTRPSSEALARRVLAGRPFPRINNVVDGGNLASLETLIPIGLYDVDRVESLTLKIRLSRGGEVFRPIGGGEEVLREGMVILASNGQVLHLYPHRDSVETMIREDTRRVLVLAAGVPGVGEDLVGEAAAKTVEYILTFAGGEHDGSYRLA